MVSKGDKVTCIVLNVDQERKRIALGLKQMNNDPWEGDIPGRYKPGEIKKGKVTKLTNFGVFVELEPGLEGLLHISELADHKVESPEDVVKVGDEIEVKVLRVDAADRKIGLSRKRLHWTHGGRRRRKASGGRGGRAAAKPSRASCAAAPAAAAASCSACPKRRRARRNQRRSSQASVASRDDGCCLESARASLATMTAAEPAAACYSPPLRPRRGLSLTPRSWSAWIA